MHTPAKGAGPNKGLGGSNPPFSANDYKNCSFVISDKHLKLQWIKGLKRLSFKPFFSCLWKFCNTLTKLLNRTFCNRTKPYRTCIFGDPFGAPLKLTFSTMPKFVTPMPLVIFRQLKSPGFVK